MDSDKYRGQRELSTRTSFRTCSQLQDPISEAGGVRNEEAMKKTESSERDDVLRTEYNFTKMKGGVRGK